MDGPVVEIPQYRCHKVVRAQVDPRRPGVLGSLTLARPDPAVLDVPGTIHRVFGPAPDVTFAWMGASYAPHLSTSPRPTHDRSSRGSTT